MSWLGFVSNLIGAIVGSGIVGFFLQAYITNRFAKKLEQFKTGLSGELFERQTRFAWLHTERSKALVRLYRLLAVADKTFTDMLRPIQSGGAESMKANIDKTGDAANKFFEYYDANRVFFSSDLTQKLRQLESEYRKVWATFVPHFGLQSSGTEWAESVGKIGHRRDAYSYRNRTTNSANARC